jgi:hypothetical protein
MNIDQIQQRVVSVAADFSSYTLEISKIALNYLGKSVEWLQLNVPIAMNNAEILAKRVAVAAWPHILMASEWTIQNKDFIIVGSVCFVAGAALHYLLQPKKAATV